MFFPKNKCGLIGSLFLVLFRFSFILFYATFVIQVIFNVLVGSLYEDLGDDPGFWTQLNSP
jgi:hypothetical protein